MSQVGVAGLLLQSWRLYMGEVFVVIWNMVSCCSFPHCFHLGPIRQIVRVGRIYILGVGVLATHENIIIRNSLVINRPFGTL